MSGPGRDEFAAHLGIQVTRLGSGHTVSRLTTDGRHANPHATVHGAVFYAVAGAAVAAAANDAEHSGIISSVLVEYLQPAAVGDELYAEVRREISTDREDIFTGTVSRGEEGDLLAWVRAPGDEEIPVGLKDGAATRDRTRAGCEQHCLHCIASGSCVLAMAESEGIASLTPSDSDVTVGA